MLHHVGLSIIEPAEIREFYEAVLHFRRLKQFNLDSEEVLHSIFDTDRQTEVCMMELKIPHFITSFLIITCNLLINSENNLVNPCFPQIIWLYL